MPVVLRVKGYKFWFYQADLTEPPHVHVAKDGKEAKYWLQPIDLARAGRFKSVDHNEISKIIRQNIDFLLNVWNEEQIKRADS